MYPGYLKYFYSRYNDAKQLRYDDLYRLLMYESTEFAASYTRNFLKAGIDARCIVGNDLIMQTRWKKENNCPNLNGNDLLTRQVEIWKPEILWIEDIKSLTEEWIKSIKQKHKYVKLIGAYHCSPFNQRILSKLQCVDFVVTCTPGLKQSMDEAGIKSHLVYHGFDQDFLSRLNMNEVNLYRKIVFSGSLFAGGELHNARIDLIEKILRAGLGLELYVNLENPIKIRIKKALYHISVFLERLGMGGFVKVIPVLGFSKEPVRNYSKYLLKSAQNPVFGPDMYSLFSKSKIVLNMHLGMAGEYAGNMRLFEVTGVGSCLLTDNKKNIGDLFVPGREIVVYNDPEDCVEKIKWLLEHEDERNAIALAGNRRTLTDHTVEKRCRQIIGIINTGLNRG